MNSQTVLLAFFQIGGIENNRGLEVLIRGTSIIVLCSIYIALKRRLERR